MRFAQKFNQVLNCAAQTTKSNGALLNCVNNALFERLLHQSADIESRQLPLNWQSVRYLSPAKHFQTPPCCFWTARSWRLWRGSTASPLLWKTRGEGAWRRRRRRTRRGTASARGTTAAEGALRRTEAVARVWSWASSLRRSCKGREGKASSSRQVDLSASSHSSIRGDLPKAIQGPSNAF